MIKKIIGILATIAILALIVMTAIGAGSYKSMLPEDLFSRTVDDAVEQAEPSAEVAQPPAEEITEEEKPKTTNYEKIIPNYCVCRGCCRGICR